MGKIEHISEIQNIIFMAIDDTNQLLPEEYQLKKSSDTLLFDNSGKAGLDSLSLINFVIAVERKIKETLGVTVVLTNEDTAFRRSNQFVTIGALASLIAEIIGENNVFKGKI